MEVSSSRDLRYVKLRAENLDTDISSWRFDHLPALSNDLEDRAWKDRGARGVNVEVSHGRVDLRSSSSERARRSNEGEELHMSPDGMVKRVSNVRSIEDSGRSKRRESIELNLEDTRFSFEGISGGYSMEDESGGGRDFRREDREPWIRGRYFFEEDSRVDCIVIDEHELSFLFSSWVSDVKYFVRRERTGEVGEVEVITEGFQGEVGVIRVSILS